MESHEKRADELEREADRLEDQGEQVDDRIDAAREDWDAKQSSTTAPGAMDEASAAPGGLGEEEDDS
jgi:hypothetical protein